ncbi:MAG: hypothetical protein AB7P12_10795, partial [Alphaproteobacteria bacterium]
MLAVLGEGNRHVPTGLFGAVTTVLSVTAVLGIVWIALFSLRSEHFIIGVFIALTFPVAFLTTTGSRYQTRISILDVVLAAFSAGL